MALQIRKSWLCGNYHCYFYQCHEEHNCCRNYFQHSKLGTLLISVVPQLLIDIETRGRHLCLHMSNFILVCPLSGIVVIEPEWLALFAPGSCQFSKPLEEPAPRYDPAKDQIVCHCTATFGPHCWPIPAVEVEFPAGVDRFRWFARALLDGSVCPGLERFVPHLLSKPATMIKAWAKWVPSISSKKKMKKKNPAYRWYPECR